MEHLFLPLDWNLWWHQKDSVITVQKWVAVQPSLREQPKKKKKNCLDIIASCSWKWLETATPVLHFLVFSNLYKWHLSWVMQCIKLSERCTACACCIHLQLHVFLCTMCGHRLSEAFGHCTCSQCPQAWSVFNPQHVCRLSSPSYVQHLRDVSKCLMVPFDHTLCPMTAKVAWSTTLRMSVVGSHVIIRWAHSLTSSPPGSAMHDHHWKASKKLSYESVT